MKFYTSRWWAETSRDDGDDTNERYKAYIDSVRAKLSAQVLRLVESVTLHDARVKSLALDSNAQQLTLSLNGYDYRPLSAGGTPTALQIEICYERVSSFFSTGEHGTWFKDCDLGYHEIEVIGRGRFEHRMLFDSGDEVVVRFHRLTVETIPQQKASSRPSKRRVWSHA